jgi:crotonobetainyl-CoA:carnitine CoA-transferase CaiB-like acyl-CoA transferase
MPGYDFLLQAESGLMSITGDRDGGPVKLGVAIVDVCTGQYAAMTILAALNARNNNKKGQRIDLSLFNTSLSMLINVASNYLVGDLQPERFGNGHPNIVPYSDFQCDDGFIAIAVGNDNQFARLAVCLGRPEWSENDLYTTNSDRVINRADIEQKITAILLKKSVNDWLVLFESNGIPCSKINSVSEALESKQAKVNEMVLEQDHPIVGKFRTLGIPYNFSETPAKMALPPPLLGADTDDILMHIVGLDPEKISKLRNDGII